MKILVLQHFLYQNISKQYHRCKGKFYLSTPPHWGRDAQICCLTTTKTLQNRVTWFSIIWVFLSRQ